MNDLGAWREPSALAKIDETTRWSHLGISTTLSTIGGKARMRAVLQRWRFFDATKVVAPAGTGPNMAVARRAQSTRSFQTCSGRRGPTGVLAVGVIADMKTALQLFLLRFPHTTTVCGHRTPIDVCPEQ